MNQKVAIVTTLRNAGPSLDSFIRYHLSLGFERMFLFFDDPNDPDIAIARRYPRRVAVIPNDENLRRAWRRTRQFSLFTHFSHFIEREVMARQMLNTEVAIGLAMKEGLDWLLHIDSDELFYSPGQSVAEHFGGLSSKDIRRITYRNYEAVPGSADIEDCFAEVTLFKKNTPAISRGELPAGLSEITGRVPQVPDSLFHFYKIGKSAARLCEGLMPNGVHDFIFPEEVGQRLMLPKLPHEGGGGDESVRTWTSARAFILHYACCGFESFWNKYRTLGSFDDKWFGQFDIGKRLPFHIEARDVVMRGDRAAARDFYERRFVVSNRVDAELLIRSNIASRIEWPAAQLKEHRQAA